MKKLPFLLWSLFLLTGSCSSSNPSNEAGANPGTAPIGGAHIAKPFVRDVAGAQCLVGSGANKGDLAFGFPQRSNLTATLSFTLGPLTNSPGQEKNSPYAGAGSYSNVGILIRPESGSPIAGFGNIVVNGDLQTGSFELNDHSASGTWDCGIKLNP